jgi:hypothetical protein
MRHSRFAATLIRMLVFSVPLWTTACQPIATESPVVRLLEGGEGSEPLPLSVRHRALAAAERLPQVRIDGVARAVQISVERAAFCNTQARATIARSPGQLTSVSHVGGDPAALCAPVFNLVVEYVGVVSGLAPGRYRVQVYEAVGDGKPVLLSTTTVAAS